MTAPRRCLVIGLGQIGAGYDIDIQGASVYTHARAISLHPAFELVGGVDPDEAQQRRFESRYGVRAYDTIGDAMAALKPAVIVVATPATMHLQHVQEALAAADLPEILICEKPLAFDRDEGRAIVSRCETAGVRLFVNYIRRAEPGAIEILNRLQRGQIATPVKGAFWYSKGIFNNGSHFINLLQSWLGDVQGYTVLDAGRRWMGADPEPDIHLRFANGSVAINAAWEEDYSYYGGELVSRSGKLTYADGGGTTTWQGVVPNSNFSGHTMLSPEWETIHNDMDRYQWHVYEQLSRFLGGDSYYLCTGKQALETLEVVTAVAGNYGILG